MKDNTKITLTVGQLRKLVKESLDGDFPKILGSACKSIKFAGIDLADYFYVWYKAEEEGDKERALEMLKKIKHTGEHIDQLLDDIRNLNIGDTPSISGWKGGPVTETDSNEDPTESLCREIEDELEREYPVDDWTWSDSGEGFHDRVRSNNYCRVSFDTHHIYGKNVILVEYQTHGNDGEIVDEIEEAFLKLSSVEKARKMGYSIYYSFWTKDESYSIDDTLEPIQDGVAPVTEDNEGGEPTFDISAAIKSGNFKIQGIRERAGANPVNVRMFALCMYQKSDTGWLNLNLVFDMAYAWAMFYDGNRKKDRPWDERRIGSKDGSLLIDDSIVEELKSNPDLHKAIEDHVEYCCKGNSVDEKKDMVFKKLENLKVSGTNRFAQAAIDTSNHEKALKDAVEYCKATYPEIVGGHSTQWYDQGGPGDPWDYDGDDDLSLERTFEIFDIDSKEKVDALAKAGKMSKTVNKGNFSTTYRVVFKK